MARLNVSMYLMAAGSHGPRADLVGKLPSGVHKSSVRTVHITCLPARLPACRPQGPWCAWQDHGQGGRAGARGHGQELARNKAVQAARAQI